MKRLPVLLILTILMAGLVLFRLGDNNISIASTLVPPNEVTSSTSEASNSSASATITITMTGILNE